MGSSAAAVTMSVIVQSSRSVLRTVVLVQDCVLLAGMAQTVSLVGC